MTVQAPSPERVKRRLAVILASDVAGYSRLVGVDEEDTVRRLGVITARFRELVNAHDGRVFNTAGDAVLAEFTSAVDAVRCALDIQEATRAANIDHALDRRIAFRIGIAVGDVIVGTGGDLLGDGVNIAARLETLASPGGICVSEEVRTHVQAKIDPGFTDLGLRELKNIAKPVRAFSLGPVAAVGVAPPVALRSARRWLASAAIGLILVVGMGAISRLLLADHVAGPKRPFVAERVPFVSDNTRAMLRDQFTSAPEHKAIALARDGLGVAVGAATSEQAMLLAMEKCEAQSKAGCEAYASDDALVWPRPFPPLPEPMRVTGAYPIDLERLPRVSADDLARAGQNFVPGGDPKALAVGVGGKLGWAFGTGSVVEAIRRAMERCFDRSGSACLLYAIDSQATEQIPRSHAVIGYVDWTTIPGDDRVTLQARYRGTDWRAMARNENGRFFAASGEKSEDDAAAAALTQCRASAVPCHLHAIGSFLVAAE